MIGGKKYSKWPLGGHGSLDEVKTATNGSM